MKDASETPRSFKRYKVTSEELKAALGIDWPGHILSVRDDYSFGGKTFTVTMYVQPHELRGADRERYTQDVSVPVPAAEPVPPAPEKKGRWRR